MPNFKVISPTEITENVFKSIGDDWALITAKRHSDGKYNTMTASWGFMGIMWHRPAFTCFVRPQRYTHEFTEDSDRISLTFFGGEQREALKLLGTKSGRDCDKIALAGLTPVEDGEYVYFEEASLVVCGRKMYTDTIKPSGFLLPDIDGRNYPNKDYHTVYMCEIEKVLKA